MALVKCWTCENKHEKTDMECHVIEYESGSVVRKYYHKGECWEKFLFDREFTDKENIELDYLYNIIKEIHKIDIVPKAFFSGYLQPLRNGNFKMGKKVIKKKEGFSYTLIADTYKFCKDSIKYNRENKKFDGTTAELKYCLAIVVDKIAVVKKRQQRSEMKKKIEEEKSSVKNSTDSVEFEQREVKFKKKKDVNDISDFLD